MTNDQMKELRALMAAEGLTAEKMHRCGINAMARIKGEIPAAKMIEQGWICIFAEEKIYLLVTFEPGAWELEETPETLTPEVEAEL